MSISYNSLRKGVQLQLTYSSQRLKVKQIIMAAETQGKNPGFPTSSLSWPCPAITLPHGEPCFQPDSSPLTTVKRGVQFSKFFLHIQLLTVSFTKQNHMQYSATHFFHLTCIFHIFPCHYIPLFFLRAAQYSILWMYQNVWHQSYTNGHLFFSPIFCQ